MDNDFTHKFRTDELEILSFKYWKVSVRPKQVTIGSLIISLKRNCEHLGGILEDETKELALVFSGVEKLLRNAFSFDEINYLSLMMVDHQVHFHVIPRYEKACVLNGNDYTDEFYPAPADINAAIDIENIELQVLAFLKEVNSRKIIGYTTGVYDLFHVGHLNVLKSAKSFCDYLIVGVTSDDLSLSRKSKLPIISLTERMEIVRNIKFVDEVVIQETMDKFDAWSRLKFNRMFVGDDWKGTDKWNQLELEFGKLGVDIVYFSYTDSTSSTKIRHLIEEKLI